MVPCRGANAIAVFGPDADLPFVSSPPPLLLFFGHGLRSSRSTSLPLPCERVSARGAAWRGAAQGAQGGQGAAGRCAPAPLGKPWQAGWLSRCRRPAGLPVTPSPARGARRGDSRSRVSLPSVVAEGGVAEWRAARCTATTALAARRASARVAATSPRPRVRACVRALRAAPSGPSATQPGLLQDTSASSTALASPRPVRAKQESPPFFHAKLAAL